jgi:allantoin racemase
MRIFWQSFIDASANRPYMEALARELNRMADPGTVVEVVGISPPDRAFGRLAELRCAVVAVDNAIQAERDGFDAVVIGHFQDPGVYEARSTLGIPVIGTGEATMHTAAQLGRRMGLVSLDPVFEVWHLEQAERYALADRVVGVAGLGVVPQDFTAAFAGDVAAHARLREAFVAKALPLVAAGADTIIAAGVLPGLLLTQEIGLLVGHAPVVSCAAVALKQAEMWVRLHRLTGLGPSRGPSFAQAPPQAIEDFRRLAASGRGA